MLRKITLLATFFSSLLVLQQTQPGAEILPYKHTSQTDTVQASGIPSQLYITVAHLNEDDKPIYENGEIVKCTAGDTAYGCGEAGSGYPYGNENPVWISMEDYLRDVLPREMDVAKNTHTLASLQAQALAARSYADYRLRLFGEMDNSVNFQVFIPNAYELYDPSATELINDAVTSTSGQYLSLDSQAIDAQFASDSINRTATCLNADLTQCHPYLLAVEDPISAWQLSQPECDAINNGNASVDDPTTPINEIGKVWGMSQKGAIRWSKGSHCAAAGDLSWPVAWTDYRQILVHYYTGIDLLDAGGSPVAPNDRWNLLWHNNFGFDVGAVPVLDNAHLYPLQLQLQNTSVSDWAENEIALSYQWTVRGIDPDPENWLLLLTTLPALEKGASTPNRDNSPLTVSVPAPCGTGGYTLHLDVGRNGAWFSTGGWPDARIDVTVQLSTPQTTAGRGYYADGLGAFYYNDQDDGGWQIGGPITWQTFSPPIVFSAVDPSINFDTDTTSPKPGVNGTFWSATWEGNLYAPQAGQYRFYLGGLDDGGRLIVDDATHIESWLVQGPHEYFSLPLSLTQGLHSFRVEYAQGPGDEAGLSVCWEGPGFSKEVIGASGAIPGQPTPTPFITPTSIPPATPTSAVTPTSTPLPTPEPWGQWFAAEEAVLQDESPETRETFSNLLSRVRDEVMLPDPKGDAYIRLVYRHAPEITALLMTDPELRDESRVLLLEVRPLLEELLDEGASNHKLSADWIKRALTLLEKIQPQAGPELKREIRWWRVWLPRFENKNGGEIWKMLPQRETGRIPRTEGSPEELILQSLPAEDARAFGQLLSRVRDEVMRPNKGGEVYIALVYRYTPEVTALLLGDETMRKEAEALLLEARPGIQFWLGETKSEWRFSENWVKRMDALLRALAEKGSPQLQTEAAWWRESLAGWAGKTPQDVWTSLLHETRVNIEGESNP